jgi:hypothetical protein
MKVRLSKAKVSDPGILVLDKRLGELQRWFGRYGEANSPYSY